MNHLFDQLVERHVIALNEQQPQVNIPTTPPPSSPSAGGDGMPSGMPPPDISLPPPPEEKMDDDSKKEADPSQFTKSVLEKLLEISPEMFNNYIDMYSNSFRKIEDKEQFKHYYYSFFKEMKHIINIQEKLKDVFKYLQTNISKLTSSDDTTPDMGKGGVGKQGPSGPGV